MGTSYTRNDTSNNIADGNIINAADLDGEFDAIESAFSTSGHTHDGTSAEGGPVTVLGPVQDFVASATEIKPKTTNTLDIGTNSLLFKDMFLDGVATLGSIKIDNAGTIGSASDSDAIAISSGGVVSFSQNTIGKTGSGYVLSLQTSDTTVEATNVLGKIEFSAPDEASGTDAILVGASIEALAEDTFDSSTNSTALVFKTNTTGAATERMRLTSAGDLHFLDNRKAIFGAGSDLQIYHSGTGSYITEAGVGDLYIQASNLILEDPDGNNYFAAIDGGATLMYHNGASKLATTSTGIAVTGNATFADNGKAIFGAGSDLQIYHDGAHSRLKETGQGDFYFDVSNSLFIRRNDTSALMASFETGIAKLYYDNSTKLATTSTGIDVTGTVTADGLTVEDADGATIRIQSSDTSVDGGSLGQLEFYSNDASTGGTGVKGKIQVTDTSSFGTAYEMNFFTGYVTGGAHAETKKMSIGPFGDISFYEDTGTTAKFFWDASFEGVGIGTTTMSRKLNIKGDQGIRLFNDAADSYLDIDHGTDGAIIKQAVSTKDILLRGGTASGQLIFETGGSERMRIDSSGDLTVKGGRIFINESDNGNTAIGLTRDADEGYVQVYSAGSITSSIRGNGDSYFNGGNVGIGTSSPTQALHVESSSVGVTRAAVINTGNAAAGAGVQFITKNGATQVSNATLRTDNAGNFNIFTGTTGDTERLRIDSSGNLLVGKTTGGVAIDGFQANAAGYATITDTSFSPLILNRKTSDGTILDLRKNGSPVGSIGTEGGDLTIGTGDTGIQFGDGGDYIRPWNLSTNTTRDNAVDLGVSSTRFKDLYLSGKITNDGTGGIQIDTSGNVGIGESSPQTPLHIRSDLNSGYNAALQLDNNSTTVGSEIALLFRSRVGTTNTDFSIAGVANAANDMDLTFLSDGNTERMRIDSSGNLLVGTTSGATNSAGIKFYNAGGTLASSNWVKTLTGTHNAIRFYHNGANVGNIQYSDTATSYLTSSDYRLKENVVELTDATDRLKQIPVHRFNFIADADTTVDGFLAHEVQTVVPEAISGTHNEVDDDGNPVYQGIDQSKLVPLLVATIKELEARITALENA